VAVCGLQVNAGELRAIRALLGDRDEAIRSGMVLQGVRYEVRGAETATDQLAEPLETAASHWR
jgi:hypothetical protein